MFIGTVPSAVLRFFPSLGRYSVGCVGGFSIPLSVRGRLHMANDITLLSLATSKHLNGEIILDLRVYDRDLHEKAKKYLNSEKQLAAIAVIFEMTEYITEGHRHAKRFLKHIFDRFDYYVEDWWKRNNKFGQLKHEYYNGDVFDFVDFVPRGELLALFPPTYKGGYEKMMSKLHELFRYRVPRHTVIGEKEYLALFEKVKRRGNYLFLTDRELNGREILYYEFKTRRKPIRIYSDVLPVAVSTFEVASLEPPPFEPLEFEDDLTERTKIEVVKAEKTWARYARARYFMEGANFSLTEFTPFMFLADGKYFGVASFKKVGTQVPENVVLMIEDFVVWSKYKRLSKLLLMLVKTREMKRALEDIFLTELDEVCTTVSVGGKRRNALFYKAEFENRSIGEVYSEWLRRYGEILR